MNRTLQKIPFYRLTSTDLGVLLSRTETPSGDAIVRTNTPRPITERDTQPWLETLPHTMARYHQQHPTLLLS